MGYSIVEAMNQIARQKNIDFEVVVETLEAGLLAAAKKKYPDANNITFSFSKQEGEITMMAVKRVVEVVEDKITEISLEEAVDLDKTAKLDDEMEIFIDHEEFGRNAVASAKQILIQRVREAERVRIYEQYKDRVGKLVSGVVTQVDKTGYLINLGDAEAFLPTRELIPRERFRQGDRVRGIISTIEQETRGPQITLSRVSDAFLEALFELEVPEIYERVIEIVAIAREPGERAKIAVSSIDDRIDPIGACVGIKGVRVQAVVRELNNERIDIVLHTTNPELFVTRSLAPSKVTALDVYRDEQSMTVAVEDEKLSLAIGRGGQNARLASRLTGWRINILSDSEYNSIKRRQAEMLIPIGRLGGVGPKMEERLVQSDFISVQSIADTSVEDLMEVEGIGKKTAEVMIETAREMAREAEQEFLAKERAEKKLQAESKDLSKDDPESMFKTDGLDDIDDDDDVDDDSVENDDDKSGEVVTDDNLEDNSKAD